MHLEILRGKVYRRLGGSPQDGIHHRPGQVEIKWIPIDIGFRLFEALATRTAALRAHDPDRTLERGYALLLDERGELLAGASALRGARHFTARLADGSVAAQVTEEDGGSR